MNIQECANCATYDWKQVEVTSKLQKCKNCELIFYCSKECQTEHWKKVHKSHCKYFRDPSLAQQFCHKAENCFICLMEHPRFKLNHPNNPNYKCNMDWFTTQDFIKKNFHPHPFPYAGQPGDTVEKAVVVLGHLADKIIRIQHTNCEPLIPVFIELFTLRCVIWRNRKMFPQAKAQTTRNLHLAIVDRLIKIEESNKTMPDPFQMWKSIFLVDWIFLATKYSQELKTLKDPFASLHIKFHSIVAQALENSPKYLSVAEEVLEALASQVVPYEEVLKIICGGSLKKRCSFCSKAVLIDGVANVDDNRRPTVIFTPPFVRIYGCSRNDCLDKVKSMHEECVSLQMAITTTRMEREGNQCDYCFQLPPTKDVHRCGRCRTKMYCSVSCKDQDWDIHKLGCKKEDVEERKVKAGSSGRREVAAESKKDVIEKLEKIELDLPMADISERFNNLKFKHGKKKAE